MGDARRCLWQSYRGKESQMLRTRSIGAMTLMMLLALLLAACGNTGQGGDTATPAAAPPTTAPAAASPTTAPAAASPTTAPTEVQVTASPAEAQATTPPAEGASGGTLHVGLKAAPDSLNPGAAYLSEAFEIFGLVYESLITTDLLNKPQPQLAKEYSVAADGKTWTFKLHEGVKWHDGQPLTSEDVAFTYNMIRGFDAFALIKDYTTRIEKVETP